MRFIDDILADENGTYDYVLLAEEHKCQLAYFMHERLVHLLVTLTFALLAFGTFFVMYLSFEPYLVLLFFALMILLIPYIMHYFLLENGVQKMYCQYDALMRRIHGEKVFGSSRRAE